MQLLDDMHQQVPEPNAITYTEPKRALQLFDGMQRQGRQPNAVIHGSDPMLRKVRTQLWSSDQCFGKCEIKAPCMFTHSGSVSACKEGK